jgi:hypothetical protein
VLRSVAGRVFGVVAFFWIVCAPVYADSTPDELIQACRAKFGDTLPAPDSSGAIHVIESGGWFSRSRNLCLYGSLENLQADGLAQAITRMGAIDSVVVRSTGGAVRTWLTLAEVLHEQVQTVIVDEICMSSCANYAFLLGQRHVVPKGGLVVWHGGPVEMPNAAVSNNGGRDVELADLTVRTAEYYRRRGVSLRLLSDTNELAIEPDANYYFSKSGNAYPESFDGYAIDPAALSRCYGFTGLEDMWHPVFFEAVYSLGKSRSANLNLLMRPANMISPPCGRGAVNPKTPATAVAPTKTKTVVKTVADDVSHEANDIKTGEDEGAVPVDVANETNGKPDTVSETQGEPTRIEKYSIPASLRPTILDEENPAGEIKLNLVAPRAEPERKNSVVSDAMPSATESAESVEPTRAKPD